ncbi:MAG: aryl-sulfate sulfotransferase [Candidatus Eisenbacteria bacterium]
MPDIDLTRDQVDYVHCNAIDRDTDGNILFSGRNTNEITKIDRTSGEVVWRLGGPRNEFELRGDTEWFSRQHAVRRLASGTITLFDNGSARVPPRSRAIEYRLDESSKTVTRVWEYEHPRSLYGAIVGYVQRLSNGNTLVSFGDSGVNTEVRLDGTIAWEMEYEPDLFNYRAYRHSWTGSATAPYLWVAAADTAGRSATLGFETFGRTEPTVYRLFRSTGAGDESLVATTAGRSFEISDLPDGVPVRFRVETDGDVALGPSNEVEVFFSPGVPALVGNVAARADAGGIELTWQAASDERISGFLVLRRSASSASSSLLTDPPLPREARSYVDRTGREGESYTYVVAALLSDGRQVRSAGVPVDMSSSGIALYRSRPNPFAGSTVIPFLVPSPGLVSLVVYDAHGRLVRVLVDEWMESGLHRETWDGRDRHGREVADGLYFYRLTHGNRTRSGTTVHLETP